MALAVVREGFRRAMSPFRRGSAFFVRPRERMTHPLLGAVSLVEVAIYWIFDIAVFAILGLLVLAVLVWCFVVLFREIGKVRRRRH